MRKTLLNNIVCVCVYIIFFFFLSCCRSPSAIFQITSLFHLRTFFLGVQFPSLPTEKRPPLQSCRWQYSRARLAKGLARSRGRAFRRVEEGGDSERFGTGEDVGGSDRALERRDGEGGRWKEKARGK